MKTIIALFFLVIVSGCGGNLYKDQSRFDQWAASCQAAESNNVERCARSMYVIEIRTRGH